MTQQRTTLYYGVIPDYMGYGIAAYGDTVEEVYELLKAKFNTWKKDSPMDGSGDQHFEWPGCLEYFGACICRVSAGMCDSEGDIGDEGIVGDDIVAWIEKEKK